MLGIFKNCSSNSKKCICFLEFFYGFTNKCSDFSKTVLDFHKSYSLLELVIKINTMFIF